MSVQRLKSTNYETWVHFGLLMHVYFLIVRFNDWLRITPGGRKCWNITLQDDVRFDLQGRNTHEQLSLRIAFYTTSRSITYHYSYVIVVEDESGKMYRLSR